MPTTPTAQTAQTLAGDAALEDDPLEWMRLAMRRYREDGTAAVNLDLPQSLWDTVRRTADQMRVDYRTVLISALTEALTAREVDIETGYRRLRVRL